MCFEQKRETPLWGIRCCEFLTEEKNASDLGLAVGHLLVVDTGPQGALGGTHSQLLHRHHHVLMERSHRLVGRREVQVVGV